jgi:hypothetical protein
LGNIYYKSNFIELKTLQYYFDWDTKKAENVYKIRHCLKSDGFELFIKFYFEKLGFKMNKWIWGHKADWWIDLKWDTDSQKIYIQCKKYIKNHNYKWKINVWEIRNFFWGVVSLDKNFENTLKIFINTWDYTDYARNFWKDNNIEIWDYEDIASICEVYNYEDFKDDLRERKLKIGNYISYHQSGISPVRAEELDDEDIFIYLSNIREKLAKKYENESNLGLIYTNETLKVFAKKRPHNLLWLKEIWDLVHNDFEKYHVSIYWKEILKWLQLLKN